MNVPRREKNGNSAFAGAAEARRRASVVRPRWASLAGSILAGVVVGAWLWSGGSGNSLGDDALSHIEGEVAALAATAPAEPEVVARVLEQGGIRLRPGAGEVLYANTCRFRGDTVPHLVVRTEVGPVALLVLRDEPAGEPSRFTGGGFSGRIVPSGTGSLALVSSTGANLEQAAAELVAAVEWL